MRIDYNNSVQTIIRVRKTRAPVKPKAFIRLQHEPEDNAALLHPWTKLLQFKHKDNRSGRQLCIRMVNRLSLRLQSAVFSS